MKRWQWLGAILLFLIIFMGERSGIEDLQQNVHRIVYSSEDILWMRATLQSFFLDEEEIITVSAHTSIQKLLSFDSVEQYSKGLLLHYDTAVPIQSLYNGLVVFTGHMKNAGQTVSILYEEGTTVTYGYVDQIAVLPYIHLQNGQLIAMKKPGKLYIQIEQQGKLFSAEEILQWLKEQGS